MIAAASKAGAKVLLVGMKLPPNYGPATRASSTRCIATPRRDTRWRWCRSSSRASPRNELFQADRIHPTLAAQPMLLDNVWPVLQPLLGKPR